MAVLQTQIAKLFEPQSQWIALGVGLVILAIALLVLMLSRWGQVRPLYKCAALSIFAHLLLAGAAYLTHWLESPRMAEAMRPVRVQLDPESTAPEQPTAVPEDRPWQRIPMESPLEAEAIELERRELSVADLPVPPQMPPTPFEPTSAPTVARVRTRDDAPSHLPVPPDRALSDVPGEAISSMVMPADAPVTRQTVPELPTTPEQGDLLSSPQTSLEQTSPRPGPGHLEARMPSANRTASANRTPSGSPYQNRFAADRNDIIRRFGGSEATEAAVERALEFLANAQAADGRWDASRWEAGHERYRDGHDRQQAGLKADTGISALALLAFMAAGHTSHNGDYRAHVDRGLQYLISRQASDGDLSGNAGTFASMYCHGMSLLALAEAYALTGDERLQYAVERGVRYSLDAQHPQTGGWRYSPWSRPRDRAELGDSGQFGDMSQFGWQVMALYSARQAGVDVPAVYWQRMLQFLQSCALGSYGGLSAYQPGQLRAVSASMTAEAMFMRFLLKNHHERQLRESADFVARYRPGSGATDHYLWYYGTMALFQMQDRSWQLWNHALTTELLGSQVMRGAHRGSWDPDEVWGQHGGRIYATALSTLCLEVYYRYLPMMKGS